MNKKWLILDSNYLCHRARYATGDLSYGGKPTEVIYIFLKSLSAFQSLFNTPDIIFCWDSKTSKREGIFPEYKLKRKDKYKDLTKEEVKFERGFRYQMKMLRTNYLKAIGFRNVFCQKGYESDDIIASICRNLSKGDEAVIISSDHDLYQLIHYNVSFYNPQKQKVMTLQRFKKQYGIIPALWIAVKCLAGCTTDEVPGIEGIGEKTAIKYLTGQLGATTKAYQKIEKQKKRYIRINHPLVALPFAGVKTFRLREDKLSEEGWKKVTEELGMKSIQNKFPFGERR